MGLNYPYSSVLDSHLLHIFIVIVFTTDLLAMTNRVYNSDTNFPLLIAMYALFLLFFMGERCHYDKLKSLLGLEFVTYVGQGFRFEHLA